MKNRSAYMLFGVSVTSLTVLIAQPCQAEVLSSTAPRAIEARGELTDVERSTIRLFERVSPSVLQVVARTETRDLFSSGTNVQSGTGFIWDVT